MVKAYLRYEQARAFGVVASPQAPPVYDDTGKHLVTAALERLAVWDVRRGVEAKSLLPPPRESGALPAVTRIARAEGSDLVAAGHSDGTIRLWSLDDASTDVLLKGHRSEVTALRFNASGSMLVSGGKDTNVVVWDVVAETGLCRLRGHKDQVTDAVFAEADATAGGGAPSGAAGGSSGVRLVTCSKDATVKVWDLDTQHCAQTVAALGAECWSMDVDPTGRRLAVGTSDDRLHLFAVRRGHDDDGTEEFGDGVSDLSDDDETPRKKTARADENGARVPMTQAQKAASIADASNLLTPVGHMPRSDKSRVSHVRFDRAGGGLLGVQTVGRAIEVWRVRSASEKAKRLKRKQKRRREKEKLRAKERNGEEETETAWDKDAEGEGLTAADELELATVVRPKAKTRGFAWAPRQRRRPGIRAVVAVLLDNNAFEEWEIGQYADGVVAEEPTKIRTIDAQGHRADVRALALSPDDGTLLTCSHKGVKVWNSEDGACLRSVDGGYGLCAAFAPGGRHAVVGTKSGALEIVDTQAGVQLSGMRDAHAGAVWGVALLPDGSGFVTASADKTVKFFEWRLMDVEDDEDEGGEGRRELGIAHVKTLQMAEDVLSVKVTPDGKLLSVSLLDNTLKVFFVDSLKFFLSLYGHRLPALCHDVSSDSQLLASGGADKNIRIWGLDFGDCHRSVFAHEDSVTSIAFVPKTHYLFSTGKDRLVKYWDADKFEPLLTLQGHHASAWCVALSTRGEFAVTGGHDRAIRVWERTDEPFFVDEEKEKRLESLLEEGGAEDDGDDDRIAAAARENASANGGVAPAGAEAGMAGRKTLETLTAADQIVDALDVAGHERKRIDDYVRTNGRDKDANDDDEAKAVENGDDQEDEEELKKALDEFSDEEEDDDEEGAEDDDDDAADAVVVNSASLSAYGYNPSYPSGLPPNPLLMGQSPERYALSAIEKVRAADLEQAVLALPFSSALTLLDYLGGWLEAGEKTELTCRLASLIVRLHYVQLGATHRARSVLLRLRPLLRKRAKELRDLMGFNLAGMNMWETHLKEGGGGTKKDDDEDENTANFTDELIKDEDAPGLPGWG